MPSRKYFRLNGTIISIVIICGLLLGGATGVLIGCNLPTEPPPPKAATILYDMHNKEVARLFRENRIPISLDRIPQTMKNAIIAIEDHNFYKHRGINLKSIIRAILVDIRDRDFSQGASTITQQLARNALLTQKKTITRKVKEIFIAFNLERNLTKDEILEKYLNQIYFGHGAWGVEAASQLYFGKHVWELQLHQYALLASLPKGPTLYSPYHEKERALQRRSIVLQEMHENGFITAEEAKAAAKRDLDVIPLNSNRGHAAYFVDYVLQELTQKYHLDEEAIYTEGFQIYTTLDNSAQFAAESAIGKIPQDKPDQLGVIQPQAALVAIDPKTGYIKAMVGGRDFQNTQLNRAVKAHRQPGSAMKPFVFVTAIDSEQLTPASIMVDEPLTFNLGGGKEYAPKNVDGKFRGNISLRDALEKSVNIISIKLVDEFGPSRVMSYARKMGLKSLVTSGRHNDLNLSSMALGGLTNGVTPLELASAYTPLANQGIHSEPMGILMVKDDQGNVLIENTTNKSYVLRKETAFLVTDMLRGVIERGTGQRANIGRPAAGKTGTSSDYTNAWFVGYTPDLLAAVWIGNDSQKLPIRVNGKTLSSSAAAGVWGDFMRNALKSTPVSDFIPPPGVVTGIEVCAESGFLASPLCPDIRSETFISGTEPTDSCNIHGTGQFADTVSLDICLESGAVATPDCPLEKIVRKTYFRETGLEVRDGTFMPTERCPIHGKRKMVSVRICTDSGLLATPYCPKDHVVTQSFYEGEQPKEYCDYHSSRGPMRY
jgi:penicillin-binding protein 1A